VSALHLYLTLQPPASSPHLPSQIAQYSTVLVRYGTLNQLPASPPSNRKRCTNLKLRLPPPPPPPLPPLSQTPRRTREWTRRNPPPTAGMWGPHRKTVCTSLTPASPACSSRSGSAWSRVAGASRATRRVVAIAIVITGFAVVVLYVFSLLFSCYVGGGAPHTVVSTLLDWRLLAD